MYIVDEEGFMRTGIVYMCGKIFVQAKMHVGVPELRVCMLTCVYECVWLYYLGHGERTTN